jgi:hypothetical protein
VHQSEKATMATAEVELKLQAIKELEQKKELEKAQAYAIRIKKVQKQLKNARENRKFSTQQLRDKHKQQFKAIRQNQKAMKKDEAAKIKQRRKQKETAQKTLLQQQAEERAAQLEFKHE